MTKRRWIILVCCILVFAAATTLLLNPDYDRKMAPRVESASNLRILGIAIRHYADEHRGVYPDSFPTLFRCGSLRTEYFVSPTRSETPANGPTTEASAAELAARDHVSYVYLGRELQANVVKADIIIAYEMPNKVDGGGNVLFGDGHVEYFGGPALAKIADRANTSAVPVTMPSQ